MLDQINRENVRDLSVAWIYHSGDVDIERKSTIECTPIVVDGVMYVTSAFTRVIALDAATGKVKWTYDPFASVGRPRGTINRGVAYWSDGRQKSILVGTVDGRLISLDAETGRPDPAFGESGIVSLREGIEQDLTGLQYGVSSAPAVFEDLVILGFMNDEGPGPAAPGDIRAFDVRTGKEVWRFHTVPRPGEMGYETWEPDSWKERGGANAWAGVTIDVERGLVFAALGSATFDLYGGDRKGENLFASSVLALDARTGEYRWHFQIIRHDLWDYDLPFHPALVTVNHDGIRKDAVAQITKTGYLFLLDRATGAPLFEVEERPVPASDVPGEKAWPTQIFPVKPPPFAQQAFEEDKFTDISEQARLFVSEEYKRYRSGPVFTPPSLRGTIVFPGLLGGANWSGGAFDPSAGVFYVNANNLPYIEGLGEAEPGKGYPYFRKIHRQFLDPEGYPAVKPPWGTLTAIDLNKGDFTWQITLGEYPELTARGIPPTGTHNFGGPIVTAGGLVFIGATADEKFHAFDKTTGNLLWEYKMPTGGYATPCTYAVSGRQFVAIAGGGGGRVGTKPGDAFIAFALPE